MADLRPTHGQVPYDGQFNTLWAVEHNNDGTSKLALDTVNSPTGPVNFNSQVLQNVGTPALSTDAVNKAYADALAVGLNVKNPVVVTTTASIALSSTQTIDGVAVSLGNRVLVKNQNDPTTNGIYAVASGAWGRDTDADTSPEVTSGMYCLVTSGTANTGTGWILTTPNPITLGTSSLSFSQFTAASSGIPTSTVTTKGDLLGATGSAAVVRVPGGSNNQLLTYDTSQAANVKWASPAVVALDAAGPPTDNTSLNASTSAHGLMPKADGNTAHFYSSDGTQKAVTATGSVATDTIWTSAGDIAAATGSHTASVTGIGTNGQVLTVNTANANKLSWATPASGGTNSPWATTLSAPASIGATAVAPSDTLPVALIALFIVVIDAWTPNAEARWVSGSYNFVNGTNPLQHNHPAGASVLIVQDPHLYLTWWGLQASSSSTVAAANVTAINNCLAQCAQLSNQIGVAMTVTGQQGHYPVNATINLPSAGLGMLEDVSLTCTTDYGSGQYALDTGSFRGRLKNVSVTSSNAGMSMASFLSGGSNPPVAMDGMRLGQRQDIEGCTAVGFHFGYALDFFDHSTMNECSAGNNMYSVSLMHNGQNGGDMKFEKCNFDGAYRAHWTVGPLSINGISGCSWKDCSWTNAPFVMFNFQILDGTMINVNTEFIGNGFAYATGGTLLLWFNVVGPDTPIIYATGGTWLDTNFPTVAAIQSGGNIILRDGGFTANYPGGISYVCDAPSGTVTLTNFNIHTDTSGAPAAIAFRGGVTSNNSRLTTNAGACSGRAIVKTTGTVNSGDLVEVVGSSGNVQQYQTTGAPAVGVTALTPIGGACSVMDEGFVNVNVHTGGSVAASASVKADLTNPGCVVQCALSAQSTINFTSITASTTSSATTVSVTGASVGDGVTVTTQDALESGLIAQSWISASGTASITLTNVTSGTIDPASHVFNLAIRPVAPVVGKSVTASSGTQVLIKLAV